MTTVYRSPTVVLDNFEWYMSVINRNGRLMQRFYFRPLSAIRYRWEPIDKFRGNLHRRFSNRFATYRRHARMAVEHEAKRAELVLDRERERQKKLAPTSKIC